MGRAKAMLDAAGGGGAPAAEVALSNAHGNPNFDLASAKRSSRGRREAAHGIRDYPEVRVGEEMPVGEDTEAAEKIKDPFDNAEDKVKLEKEGKKDKGAGNVDKEKGKRDSDAGELKHFVTKKDNGKEPQKKPLRRKREGKKKKKSKRLRRKKEERKKKRRTK